MQDICVAAVSTINRPGEPQANLANHASWTKRAGDEGAELVLFPEMGITGYWTDKRLWHVAEPVPGPSVAQLERIARDVGIVICAGIAEKEHDIVFNTQVVVGPGGYIGKSRKLHIPIGEYAYWRCGYDAPVHDIGTCKVGIVICYDNQFPEVGRIAALKGADVILMPHAAREAHWDDTPASQAAARRHVAEFFTMCYRMRAVENACFCVLADQAGRAGTVENYPSDHTNQPHHPGAAIVIGPDGAVLKQAQTEKIQDEMIICDLDMSLLAKARAYSNYTLRTRRPELFGELVRDQLSS